MTGESYRSAGVDIDAGDALVEAIKPLAKRTARSGAEAGLGGFAALVRSQSRRLQGPDPGLDHRRRRHQVEDRDRRQSPCDHRPGPGGDVRQRPRRARRGAAVLSRLLRDRQARGRPGESRSSPASRGPAKHPAAPWSAARPPRCRACIRDGDYDLAGFAVGAVERGQALDGTLVAGRRGARHGIERPPFQRLLAGPPRRRAATLDYAARAVRARHKPGRGAADPDAPLCRSCLRGVAAAAASRRLAHITGGGLIENIPRVLPDGLAAEIDATRWPLPPVFRWLAETAGIAAARWRRTFNCGIGMVAIVAPGSVGAARAGDRSGAASASSTSAASSNGRPANDGTILKGMESAWPG